MKAINGNYKIYKSIKRNSSISNLAPTNFKYEQNQRLKYRCHVSFSVKSHRNDDYIFPCVLSFSFSVAGRRLDYIGYSRRREDGAIAKSSKNKHDLIYLFGPRRSFK
jgi:hypothetical protein